MSLYKSVLFGLLFALWAIFCMSCAVGVLCLFIDFPDSLLDGVSVIILGAAAYLSAIFSTRLKRTKGLLQGFLCGLTLFLLTLLASVIFKKFTFGDMTVIKGIACIFFGSLGGVIGINSKTTKLRH